MTSVAFKNSRIFSVSSLRWKILDISVTSWVLKSLILQMDFILLKPSILLNYCLELDSLIARMLTLQLSLMRIWLPQKGNHCLIPLFTRRLVGSLVYLTVIRPDISYFVHQVSQYLSAPWSTHYATVLRILRYLKGTLFHGLFYSAQSPLVLRAFLMLIGQEIPLIAGPSLVIAFFLVLPWFLSEARNKFMWPAPVLKQNIVSLLIPHLSLFGYDGFSKT